MALAFSSLPLGGNMFSSKAWPDPAHGRGRSPAQGCWVLCGGRSAAADLHFWCMLGLPGMERGLKRLVEKMRPVIETSPTGVSGGLGKGEAANGKGNDLALPFME